MDREAIQYVQELTRKADSYERTKNVLNAAFKRNGLTVDYRTWDSYDRYSAPYGWCVSREKTADELRESADDPSEHYATYDGSPSPRKSTVIFSHADYERVVEWALEHLENTEVTI